MLNNNHSLTTNVELFEGGVVLGFNSPNFEWSEVSVVRTLRDLEVFDPMVEWSERSVLSMIVH